MRVCLPVHGNPSPSPLVANTLERFERKCKLLLFFYTIHEERRNDSKSHHLARRRLEKVHSNDPITLHRLFLFLYSSLSNDRVFIFIYARRVYLWKSWNVKSNSTIYVIFLKKFHFMSPICRKQSEVVGRWIKINESFPPKLTRAVNLIFNTRKRVHTYTREFKVMKILITRTNLTNNTRTRERDSWSNIILIKRLSVISRSTGLNSWFRILSWI